MRNRCGALAAGAVLALAVAACPSVCRGGEWGWARGQMWAAGSDTARPDAVEQAAYAQLLDRQGRRMDAARQYYLLAEGFAGSREAGLGLLGLAKNLYEMYDYFLSYQVVEEFLSMHPDSGWGSDVAAIELHIAKRLYASGVVGYPGVGCTPQEGALRKTLTVADSAIGHAQRGAVRAEACLLKAEVLFTLGDTAKAREEFMGVRDGYPLSEFAERAGWGLSRCDKLAGREADGALRVGCIVESKKLKRLSSGDVFAGLMVKISSLVPSGAVTGQKEHDRSENATDKEVLDGEKRSLPDAEAKEEYRKLIENMNCRYSAKPVQKGVAATSP